MRKYRGIDIGRVIFACLIPILHISFTESIAIDIVRQYIARLGVPFFFSVSGMFLGRSLINSDNRFEVWSKYLLRVGKMLLVWIVIYSPVIVRPTIASFQKLIFCTPAFLWYLTGLLIASFPFCFIKSRNMLYVCSAVLLLVGTLFGETYRWLLGGVPWYENIFLTTRNGIFFGLPLMCIGELTWKKEKKSFSMLAISSVLLAAEITFVGMHAAPGDDRSMYLTLPFFIFYLLLAFRDWNPDINNSDLRGISSAIYLMQFGIITSGNKVLKYMSIQTSLANWGIYLLVLIVPTVLYLLIKRTKLAKILF